MPKFGRSLTIVAMAAIVATSILLDVVTAQLPAGDLRLWLKAEDLLTQGFNIGDDVTSWTDVNSGFGTNFAPDTTDSFFFRDDAPSLEMSTINGSSFPTVRFDQSGPSGLSSSTTERLRQTNNLAGFDPTDIGDGTSMTLIAVYFPDCTTSNCLNFQTLASKRGNPASPDFDQSVWTFGWTDGINATPGVFTYVTFAGDPGQVPWKSDNAGSPLTEQVWSVGGMTIQENGPTLADSIDFFVDGSEDPNQTATFLGAVDGNGNPVDPNSGAFGPPRNDTTAAPMMISGSVQEPGERFAGNLAEMIIYAEELTPADFAQVETYLNNKYFAAGFDADVNTDGRVDGLDFLIIQQNSPENIPDWEAQYTGALSAVASVPEPASLSLLSLFALMGVNIRRR